MKKQREKTTTHKICVRNTKQYSVINQNNTAKLMQTCFSGQLYVSWMTVCKHKYMFKKIAIKKLPLEEKI